MGIHRQTLKPTSWLDLELTMPGVIVFVPHMDWNVLLCDSDCRQDTGGSFLWELLHICPPVRSVCKHG